MRKGQITVFIIVGLLIVILLGFGYYMFSREAAVPTKPVPEQIVSAGDIQSRISQFYKECLREQVAPLVWLMARNGATTKPRGDIFDTAHKNVDVWCVEQRSRDIGKTDASCANQARTRQGVEEEMEGLIEQGVLPCLKSIEPTMPGAVFNTSLPVVNVTLNPGEIIVRMDYKGQITFQESQVRFDEFRATLPIPFGRMIQIGTDVINAEARVGRFDIGEWTAKNGGDVIIQKAKPYPHVIYNLTTDVPGFNESLTVSFAVQGRDTAGREVRAIESPNGCCVMPSQDCRQNIEEFRCEADGGNYTDDRSCVCEQVSEPVIKGCCVHDDNSCGFVVDEAECDGTFNEGDLACAQAECANLRCTNTNYEYSTYFGFSKHGESWCTTDSISGFGTDFVGSRHYLHTCLNGIEYVEPCRDYREEICVGGLDESGTASKAACKINRWYDCAQQRSADACNDFTTRDCFFMPKIGKGAANKYAKKKCVPFVPPGFKVWESQNAFVCSRINQGPIFDPGPRAQGYNTLHICSRLGDCGNYRNWVGKLTKKGYKHPLGKPKAKDYAAYTHPVFKPATSWFNLAYDEREFYRELYNLQMQQYGWVSDLTVEQALNQDVDPGVEIVRSYKKGSIKCKPWVAPADSDLCELCNQDPLRPCTEYRCRTIGQGCDWHGDNGDAYCSAGAIIDGDGPKITNIEVFTEGVSLSKAGRTYSLSPALPASSRIDFLITTADEESECYATMFPQGAAPPDEPDSLLDFADPDDLAALSDLVPLIVAGALELPVGEGGFSFQHASSAYTPPPEVVEMIEQFIGSEFDITLYFSCEDRFANRGPDAQITFSLSKEPGDLSEGPVIELAEMAVGEGNDKLLRIATSVPVQGCTMQVDGQTLTVPGCEHQALNLSYADWAPYLTWPCEANVTKAPAIVQCTDLGGITGAPKQLQ